MDATSLEQLYNGIVLLLQQKRLREAMVQLEALLIQEHNDNLLKNRLEQAKVSYSYMLNYMRQGVSDPQRGRLHLKLLAEVWEIADQTRIALQEVSSTYYYYELRRTRRLTGNPVDLSELLGRLEGYADDLAVCRLMPENRRSLDTLLDRHEKATGELFASVLSDSGWNGKDADGAAQFLLSSRLGAYDLALMVSAVTLSLLVCFDLRKVIWLLDATGHADVTVSQRALVGLVLVLYTHPFRLPLYPELCTRLQLMDEDGSLSAQINRVYLQVIQAQETEKIDRKMREEIIPEMMKNVDLMRDMKFGLEDSSDENDANPDWEERFRDKLGDKLMEVNELQMEGADIYMGSFARLKNYPFFHEMYNWFMPFYLDNTYVIRTFGLDIPDEDRRFLNLSMLNGLFCDSDKYSLCFTVDRIPKAQRDMIMARFPDPEELKEMAGKSGKGRFGPFVESPESISNLYIHNLYRFYKLYPRRKEWKDIFQEPVNLYSVPVLGEMLGRPDLMRDIADFHLRKEHYAEAERLYRHLADTCDADADIFQRAGYCLQKSRRYADAVQAYRKADVLKPDSLWTVRHLATCCRLERDYAAALDYYRKAGDMLPDNRNILFYTGFCLAELERYAEALQCFFKLDLMEDGCVKAWRAIGWCSFVSGKYEQAMRYYDKLIASAPVPADYLNAGHVAWVMNDIGRAVRYYTLSLGTSESHDAFFEAFMKDKEVLVRHGIDGNEISLMQDMILLETV